jgi:hypothetical protein
VRPRRRFLFAMLASIALVAGFAPTTTSADEPPRTCIFALPNPEQPNPDFLLLPAPACEHP